MLIDLLYTVLETWIGVKLSCIFKLGCETFEPLWTLYHTISMKVSVKLEKQIDRNLNVSSQTVLFLQL